MNNILVLNSLFFGFSMFLISILVLLRRGDELGRRWFYFSVFVTGWAIPNAFLVDNRVNHDLALLASRLSHASVAFIPATWLYFVCKFLEIERKKVFLAAWPIAWFLMFTAPTAWFVPSVSPAKGYMNMTEAGFLFHLQTINFFLVVAYGFYLLMKSYFREKSKEQRKEIFALLFATGIGFAGGGSNFSLVYLRDNGLDITLLLSLYPFLMAYALVRERVLDVEKIADAFQREKLAAIGILAASLNHELRNPLYVIKGRTESFLSNWKDGLYQSEESKKVLEKAVEIFETISEQSERINGMARDFLEFDKPSSNGRREAVNLGGLIERSLSIASHQLKLSRIQIEKKVAADLPSIMANPRQMEEVLFNLIMNASQAMGNGGTIEVSAGQDNGRVNIAVKDTGPGISPEMQNRVFQPFATSREGGTGLDLYITKQLVERNGGRIRFETSPKDTNFILEFKT